MELLLQDVNHAAFAMKCVKEDRAKIDACSKELEREEDRRGEEDRREEEDGRSSSATFLNW